MVAGDIVDVENEGGSVCRPQTSGRVFEWDSRACLRAYTWTL